jgi:hypothetical protein
MAEIDASDGKTAQAEEYLRNAAHHRSSMVERRNVGLKIVVGVVSFDLVILKIALDSTKNVRDVGQMAWLVRVVVVAVFVTTAGMLYQIEVRSRADRAAARTAESRADALLTGTEPSRVPSSVENLAASVRHSWATTWPIAGMLVFTVVIWQVASILGVSGR